MNLLFKLGWRNIGRNKRRSLLTILAIMFATFLTVAMRGITTGTWEYNIKYTLELFSGYLQIQRIGYQANPSLSKSIPYPGAIASQLQNESSITGFAPRIMADGLISHRENSAGTAIFGINPLVEKNISRFHERIKSGKFFDHGSKDEVVVGEKLMENINARVGDTLVVLAQGYDGVMGNQKYRISGVVRFGVPEFDAMTVFMDLGAAQELLAMEGRINVIAIAVPTTRDVEQARTAIGRMLKEGNHREIIVLPWEEVIPELKEARQFDSIGDWFFFGILVFIAAFGILNTVLMSVTERFREFGISLAIGLPPRDLVVLVFIETVFMTMIGIALGALLGYASNVYFAIHPFLLAGDYGKMYEDYGFVPFIIATRNVSLVVGIAVEILLISCIASIYPVYKVSKLEPLKGIRYT